MIASSYLNKSILSVFYGLESNIFQGDDKTVIIDKTNFMIDKITLDYLISEFQEYFDCIPTLTYVESTHD